MSKTDSVNKAMTRQVRLDDKYTNIRHPKHSSFAPRDEIMVFESLGATVWGDVVISCYHVNVGFVAKEANRCVLVLVLALVLERTREHGNMSGASS